MQVTEDRAKLFYTLLGLILVMMLFGIIMVFSASQNSAFRMHEDSLHYLKKQATWACLGVVALLFFAGYDYQKLRKRSGIWLICAIALLAAVLVPGLGRTAGGAQRWLAIGGMSIQPSEFAKLAIIIYASDLFVRKQARIHEFKHLCVPFIPILSLVAGLILIEPDLGTSVVVFALGMTVMFVSGARIKHTAAIMSVAAVMISVFILMEPYRLERWTAFLNPQKHRLDSGYQIIQSLIAFGSGGVKGVGLGMSRQKFSYLPEAHTDFIFAIIGEELGLIGSLGFVVCMLMLIVIGYNIARKAPDMFGQTLAISIVAMIAGQAFLNIAAVTGLIPVTGIPLPLVSAGGSSLLVLLASVGILLNILIKKRSVVAKRPKSNNKRRQNGRPHIPRDSSSRKLRAIHQ